MAVPLRGREEGCGWVACRQLSAQPGACSCMDMLPGRQGEKSERSETAQSTTIDALLRRPFSAAAGVLLLLLLLVPPASGVMRVQIMTPSAVGSKEPTPCRKAAGGAAARGGAVRGSSSARLSRALRPCVLLGHAGNAERAGELGRASTWAGSSGRLVGGHGRSLQSYCQCSVKGREANGQARLPLATMRGGRAGSCRHAQLPLPRVLQVRVTAPGLPGQEMNTGTWQGGKKTWYRITTCRRARRLGVGSARAAAAAAASHAPAPSELGPQHEADGPQQQQDDAPHDQLVLQDALAHGGQDLAAARDVGVHLAAAGRRGRGGRGSERG